MPEETSGASLAFAAVAAFMHSASTARFFARSPLARPPRMMVLAMLHAPHKSFSSTLDTLVDTPNTLDTLEDTPNTLGTLDNPPQVLLMLKGR